MTQITYKKVWDTLSTVNVNEWKKKKGKLNLDYISWSAAWHILMQHFPHATYEFMPETYEANGTVMSHCIVKIGDLERYMWLPCMDNRNESLTNPTTRQIQDSRMRCMVKCLAMFGLGFYIYDGQSFPYEDEDLPDEQKDQQEKSVLEKSVLENSLSIEKESVKLPF